MKPTLIIVEDVLEAREELACALEDDFEIVHKAGAAQEAIQACLRHEPQAVVLDLVLPDGSGIDVLKEIRKKLPHPPTVILLSGVTDPRWVAAAMAAGATEYVFKPANDRRISELVRAALSRAELRNKAQIR